MEAFARSMDEYFAPEKHKSGGLGVTHSQLHDYVKKTEGSMGLAIPRITYYITLLTLMDMTLQLAYPSQKSSSKFKINSYSGFCMFINAIQVLLYISGIILLLMLARTVHSIPGLTSGSNDVYVDLPCSLLSVGFLVSISILINALNYNQLLTTGSSVILNLPRILFIIAIIYCVWEDTGNLKLSILIVLLVWVFIVACAGPTAPKMAHGMGWVGFFGGMVCTIVSIVKDLYAKGYIKKFRPSSSHTHTPRPPSPPHTPEANIDSIKNNLKTTTNSDKFKPISDIDVHDITTPYLKQDGSYLGQYRSSDSSLLGGKTYHFTYGKVESSPTKKTQYVQPFVLASKINNFEAGVSYCLVRTTDWIFKDCGKYDSIDSHGNYHFDKDVILEDDRKETYVAKHT